MDVTLDVVKELRDRTGVSIMQCKNALIEADGDIEKAIVILRKRAGVSADKKSDPELGAGAVAAYVHDDSVGALVHLSSETDFVAKNPEFVALARNIAMQVAATSPKFISRDEVTPDDEVAARAIFEKEVEGKPEDLKAQILQGKLDAYFRDFVLLDQQYIKDDSRTVADLIADAVQKFGERIIVSHISRFSTR